MVGRVCECEELERTTTYARISTSTSVIPFLQEVPALGGRNDTTVTRERCERHANPDDDGGGLSGIPNANFISAGPHHIHRIQKGMELEIQVVPPGLDP